MLTFSTVRMGLLPLKEIPMKKKEKEIGIPKNAPKAAKKADEKMDKAKGIKEGSKADLKADKKIMKRYKAY